MSSITNKKVILSDSARVTIFPMPKSRLPELIEKAKSKGLSYRDIQRRAGGEKQIAVSTIQLAHTGQADNLTLSKILALARGLGESPTVIFEAAIGKSSSGTLDESVQQLVEDYSRLRIHDKNELAPTIEMLRAEIQRRLDRDA